MMERLLDGTDRYAALGVVKGPGVSRMCDLQSMQDIRLNP